MYAFILIETIIVGIAFISYCSNKYDITFVLFDHEPVRFWAFFRVIVHMILAVESLKMLKNIYMVVQY
jgi:hypothetical protein